MATDWMIYGARDAANGYTGVKLIDRDDGARQGLGPIVAGPQR